MFITGQGRGHAFAAAANGGIGALDWGDCESMLDEVVKRGWADPDRLGVAGWSHGESGSDHCVVEDAYFS